MTTDAACPLPGSPAAGRLLARTLLAEWIRLRTLRSTWWLLAAATLVLLGLGTLLGFESAADPSEIQGEPAWVTARIIAMPAQFALLILALLAVTSDYATRGIVPSMQWTPHRSALFAARVVVPVSIASSFGIVLTAGSALAAKSTAGTALTFRVEDGLDALSRVGLVLIACTALAAGLGFLIRHTAGAIVATFMLILVLPLLLPLFGSWMQEVAERLPGAGAIYLLTDGMNGMTYTSSVLVLSTWSVATIALSWARFTRSDAT